MEDWAVLEKSVEYQCEWFDVGYDLVARPDGEHARYYWIDPGDAVGIIGLTDEDEIVLIEEYMPQLEGTTIGCPAGGRENGETPADAAAREFREETGYTPGTLTRIGTFRPESWVRMETEVFVVEDLEPGNQALEDGEAVTVREVAVDRALETVLGADVVHGAQAMPLLYAQAEGLL